MNLKLYCKLASTNIKNNSKTYYPYIFTCTASVMMYFIMYSLAKNKGLDQMLGAETIKMILSFGSVVIGCFAFVFLFYTNSFLLKRRKKEFGLFNILGMEKNHISKMMFAETVYMAVFSLVAGLACGIVLNKIIFLILLKLIKIKAQMGFEVSGTAIVSTLCLFGILYLLIFLNTIRQIHLTNPIELLKGGQVGEKEPKAKWLWAALGIVCLLGGYYVAVTTVSPLTALSKFLMAVLLVIAGTYLMFTAGSIVVLKLLRANKKYYYKTKHFTSVSGMIYRMKQNAAGLANICILSTAVLVMLSTTFSLYIGMEDLIRHRFERNIIVEGQQISEDQAPVLTAAIEEEISMRNLQRDNLIHYRSKKFVLFQEGNKFSVKAGGSEGFYNMDGSSVINVFPLDEYNRIQGTAQTLGDHEVLLYVGKGELEQDSVTLGNMDFTVKERLKSFNIEKSLIDSFSDSFCLIVNDRNTIMSLTESLAEEPSEAPDLGYYYAFDTKADSKEQIDMTAALNIHFSDAGIEAYAECAEDSRENFYFLYGGLFFIGLFLGILFIMATVLIIYYKQISEGYEDRERFIIMQKVGMSRSEVRKTIRSQVLSVFYLPLIFAGIHIAFAFNVICKLLNILNLYNTALFVWCTIGTFLVFAGFYALVYGLTAKVYYRIVS